MKKLKLKDRWFLIAGVLGGVAIGTSLIALVRVLRNRSESEDETGSETDKKGHKAHGEEGEQPVRHRRHGRHGDRRAKAGVSEDRGTADNSQNASSAQRH